RFTWGGQQATLFGQGINSESSVSPPPVGFGQTNVHFNGPLHGLSAIVTAPTGSWLLMIDPMTFEKADTNDKVKFDIASTAAEKILIHKYRQDDAYPSAHQNSVDGTVTIAATVVDQVGNPVPNRPVSLRVIDPPDRAAYVPATERHADDNLDPQDHPPG